MAKPTVYPEWATNTASVDVLTGLDIDTIAFQETYLSGSKMRYAFNGTPTLSGVTVDNDLVVTGSSNSYNNGTFRILAISDASDYIDVYNPNILDNSYDEASDATGTADVVTGAARNVTPTPGRKAVGNRAPTIPNDAIFNWWQNLVYQWIAYFDEEISALDSGSDRGYGPIGVAEIMGGEQNELEFFAFRKFTISPGVISANTTEHTDVTIYGAKAGDIVTLSHSGDLADIDCMFGLPYVASDSTITIAIGNVSGTASSDLGDIEISVKVERFANGNGY